VLRRCLAATNSSPTAGSTWYSRSLRIGAHNERTPLGKPVEARKAWFGWGSDSDAMTALYFDRQISLSPASCWIVGPASMSWSQSAPDPSR
jgi:hypothetical protein